MSVLELFFNNLVAPGKLKNSTRMAMDTNVKIKLHSDFHDYYDHYFDKDGDIVFDRMMRGGPSRSEAFKILERFACSVIPHGSAKTLYDRIIKREIVLPWFAHLKYDDNMYTHPEDRRIRWMSDLRFVVYVDEQSHAGDGKILVKAEDAVQLYPDHLASLYIHPFGTGGLPFSIRRLHIGTKVFMIKYTSHHEWKSNCGEDIEIILTGQSDSAKALFPLYPLPLFAIDNISHNFSVDFNVSPGIARCVQEVLPAQEAAELIKISLIHILDPLNAKL